MSHAGTLDLGGRAQNRLSGSHWLAAALTLVVAGSAIGAVSLANRAGFAAGTAKTQSVTYVNRYGPQPVTYVNRYGRSNAGDRSYDQIEAQRGVITAPISHAQRRVTPSGSDRIEHLRMIGRNLVVQAPRDRVGGP